MNVKWITGNCRRQQQNISLLVSGLLPAPEQAALEAHLKDCGGCRQYARELTELSQGIARLKEEAGGLTASTQLRARWTGQVRADARLARKDTPQDSPYAALAGWWSALTRPSLAWGAAAAICLALILAGGYWRTETKRTRVSNVLLNATLIRETLAMFPNHVRAIMQDEHGLNLVLSESEKIPSSAPLYVRVCDGKHCQSFVTFSGQEIQVDGQRISVLADARGKLILVGENFLWSDTDRIQPGTHWNIEARSLGSSLM